MEFPRKSNGTKACPKAEIKILNTYLKIILINIKDSVLSGISICDFDQCFRVLFW